MAARAAFADSRGRSGFSRQPRSIIFVQPRERRPESVIGAFTKLAYHIVFSTKYRQPSLRREFRERLFEYLGGIVRRLNGHLIEIGGVEDHVHLLVGLPPTITVSDAVRDIKAGVSKWINELPETRTRFEWQKGYAAFTVSHSQIEAVRTYLRNQEEHHKRQTFEEEYVSFLRRHEIEFDPRFLFEGEFHG